MDIDLALLCDAATLDASGKLNVLGVFDRIQASGLPVRHGRIALVLRFSAALNEAGMHDVEIRLRDPEGEDVVTLQGQVQMGPSGSATGGGGIRVPHILNLDGIVFQRPGRYSFDVRVDGDHHVGIPLSVEGPAPGSVAAAS